MTISRKLVISVAAGVALALIAGGAYAIGSATSGHGSSGTASAAPFARSGQRPSGQSGPNQRVGGTIPAGWHSGSGTIITGAAANKAKAVALAKYPGGTVNRVLKLSDGSYAVHYIKISWPHHVFVSKNFKVTGAIG